MFNDVMANGGEWQMSSPQRTESAPINGLAPRTVPAWIQVIHEVWSRGTTNTLELARVIARARKCLPYGHWGHLWRSSQALPFSKRKGDMLVVIGQELGDLDAQNFAQLPSAWSTLYYLALLGRTEVEEAVRQGKIHPGLTLQEAKLMLAKARSAGQQKDSGSGISVRLARLAKFIHAESDHWTHAQRNFCRSRLLALANEIQPGNSAVDIVLGDLPSEVSPLPRFANA